MSKAPPDVVKSEHGGPSSEATGETAARAQSSLLPFLERYALLFVWGLIIVIFGILEPDTFLTTSNFAIMFASQSVLVVLTLGLIVPLTSGDYDLSIAFNLTFSSMTIAVLNTQHHWPIVLAILLALAIGILIGTVNALIITLVGIDSFIVTLGTGTIIGGLTLVISGSNTISGLDPVLQELVVVPKVFGIGFGLFYAVALTAVMWYLFEYTSIGRELLFTGRNRTVAALSGINVSRMRALALIASGFLGSLAGVLYVGTTASADPTSGTTLLLPAFAAAFLGSTAIAPGKFNAWGSLFAAYFLVTGITGLSLMGIQVYVQDLFYGGALIIAVALGHVARRRYSGAQPAR